jgi:hypothetical protein
MTYGKAKYEVIMSIRRCENTLPERRTDSGWGMALAVSRECKVAKLTCACESWCGFQSESKRMQVSAAVRLMPRPPTTGTIDRYEGMACMSW